MKPQNTIEVRCIECAKWSLKRCSEGMRHNVEAQGREAGFLAKRPSGAEGSGS